MAHFIGATTRPKNEPPPQQDVQEIKAWRTGVWATATKHLVKQDLLTFVKCWICFLRSVPTAILFHTVSSYFFDTLDKFGETKCRQQLQTNYWYKPEADIAKALFKATNWIGSANFLWTADWWAGIERIQPGSTGATQSQESWHKHVLKDFIRTMRMPLPAFVQRLAAFTSQQYRLLKKSAGPLLDVPVEPYPDKFLMNDKRLTGRGRTSAHEYHDCEAYVQHGAGDFVSFGPRRQLMAKQKRGEMILNTFHPLRSYEILDASLPSSFYQLQGVLIRIRFTTHTHGIICY